MAEKKDILFQVQVNLNDSIKKIASLTEQVRILKAEEEELKKALEEARKTGFDAQGRSVDELSGLLAANREQQKAYRQEISSTSREVQNTIKAEQTYANTLKGKAAQLANEKKTLREIELGQGKLSEAYIRQRKVVADLNAEVTRLEREYGVHQRNVGNYESALDGLNGKLGKIKLQAAAVIAVIAAGFKTIQNLFNDLRNTTQSYGDFWKFEVAGWKSAYDQFIAGLAGGQGWRELIGNMRNAYTEGKRLAALLDELFERENSLKIEAADLAAEIEREKVATRDVTRTNKERIRSAERVLELEEQLAARRKEIAAQELEARREQLKVRTGMNDAEIQFFVNSYNANREAIQEAQRYVEAEADLTGRIASETQVRNYARRAELEQQLETLRTGLSAQAAANIEIVRKYQLSNDELVSGYVNAYTKYQQVDADLYRLTSRSAVQRAALIKQMMQEGQNMTAATSQAAATMAEDTAATLRRQEEAIRSYAEAVQALMSKLTDSDPLEESINLVRAEYSALTVIISEQVQAGNMSMEEALFYRTALAQREGEEVAAIRKNYADRQAQEEQQQAQAQTLQRQQQLQTDLQMAWDNADEQFRIRKDYLERELEQEELAAGRRAELEQQLSELYRQHTNERIDATMEYVSKAGSLFEGWNSTLSGIDAGRVQRWEADQQTQKDALDKRLRAGLISQKQYDDKVAAMDRDLDGKKAEIARREAIRERAASLFSVGVNTAQAIMKVWAEVPVVAAPAMTAVVAATGAVQTAAILSQPLPKAARGGRVSGATHAGGGVLLETEDEERIIAARPSRAFPELLNLISYMGKQGGVPDAGYLMRHSQDSDRSTAREVGQAVREALRDMQVWLSLSELHDAERQQVKIDQLSRL